MVGECDFDRCCRRGYFKAAMIVRIVMPYLGASVAIAFTTVGGALNATLKRMCRLSGSRWRGTVRGPDLSERHLIFFYRSRG